MKYLTLGQLLYAYDEETGLTVQFSGGKWKLADLSYAALLEEPQAQVVTKAEAAKITDGVSPRQFVEDFIGQALNQG